MKYILMMNCPKNGYEIFGTLPKKDLQAHVAYMHSLNKSLRESGELVSTAGLADPREAKCVRVAADGTPVTDGIFPESKEYLAGYWVVDVETPDQAYAIAVRVSSAPGPGGAPARIPVEVRQIMDSAPKEWLES